MSLLPPTPLSSPLPFLNTGLRWVISFFFQTRAYTSLAAEILPSWEHANTAEEIVGVQQSFQNFGMPTRCQALENIKRGGLCVLRKTQVAPWRQAIWVCLPGPVLHGWGALDMQLTPSLFFHCEMDQENDLPGWTIERVKRDATWDVLTV